MENWKLYLIIQQNKLPLICIYKNTQHPKISQHSKNSHFGLL